MTKQWLRAHKKDGYYKRAKTQGYRSRAAYKLMEINKKFKIIQKGDTVIDLGAAPGGWSQVAAENVGDNGLVIGIDLAAINPLENADNKGIVKFLKGDITKPETISKIKYEVGGRKIKVVISDLAPNISGNYSIDHANSIFLAEAALNIAQQVLTEGGAFVVKVFEGEDFFEFKNKVKKIFKTCNIFSPKASRQRSSEIYVIGLRFKSISIEPKSTI
jgi:23S rRNA (uridine2552-2'-O)-methyltransferase